MNGRGADQVQRELGDDEPAGLGRNPLVELGKIERPQAPDLSDLQRGEPGEIAQRRLYRLENRYFFKDLDARMAHEAGVEQCRSGARKADEEDRRLTASVRTCGPHAPAPLLNPQSDRTSTRMKYR